MEDNGNYQNNPMNNAGIPANPQPVQLNAAQGQPVMYQQPGVQQGYYAARPATPVPNGYGVYSQSTIPTQPVQTMVPVPQVQPAPAPSFQPVSQAARPQPEQNAPSAQNGGDNGNGGKRSIVMPLVFSIALGLLFIYSLAQSFYIVRLNKKINGTEPFAETTAESTESQPDESTQPSESEEPTQTNEDGKPWVSIEDASSATDPNKKAMKTTEIVAEVSPATVPVFVVTGSGSAEKKVSGGTGFIITKNGYIVTNAHVVTNAVKTPGKYHVVVMLPDEADSVKATIVGTDVQTDIAVLKVEPGRDLPCVRLGDSEKLQCGELVIAIGNALGQLDDTVTVGVVSGTNREISNNGYRLKVIQTDAAINNGNSGGPLLNSFGEVVGITNAKIVTSTSEGLGFAIPINNVKIIIEKLINYGKVTNRPFFGIGVKAYAEGEFKDGVAGIYITQVHPDGPADKAGIKVGDRLISLAGVEIKKANDIIDVRDTQKVGNSIEVVVDRDGTTMTFTLIVGDSGDYEDSNTTPTPTPRPSYRDRDDDEDEGEED